MNPINRLIGSVPKKVPYRNRSPQRAQTFLAVAVLSAGPKKALFKQEWVGSMRYSFIPVPAVCLYQLSAPLSLRLQPASGCDKSLNQPFSNQVTTGDI
jgi:hypothetical protein